FDGRLGEPPSVSVINIDDEWGVRLAGELRQKGQRVVTTSLSGKADITAANINVSLVRGTSFVLNAPNGAIDISSPLVGRPHVYNMLSATAVGLELGSDLASIA